MADRTMHYGDGKKRRMQLPKDSADESKGTNASESKHSTGQPTLLSGFRGRNIFCALGHSLVDDLAGKSLQLNDCATNLFREDEKTCQACGVCVCFNATLGQSVSEIGEEAAALLHPERRVYHALAVQK